MIYGGTGSIVGLAAAGGMFWLVDRINPYANKTAIVLAGLALAAVGVVANRTEMVWQARLNPSTGGVQKEKHHFFWIGIEWWGLAIVLLGIFR